MIKNEIKSVFRAKSRIILAIVIVLLIGIDAFITYMSRPNLNPAYAAFLSRSGIISTVIIVFAPLYSMYMCADSYLRDRVNGYGAVIISRVGRKKYLRDKFVVAFLIPCGLVLTGMILNLFLVMLLFNGGQDTAGFDMIAANFQEDFIAFEYNHPMVAYIMFMILGSVASGFCSVICTAVSFVTGKYPLAYLISFLFWTLLTAGHVSYLYSPFISYGAFFVIMGVAELGLAVTAAYMAAKYSFLKGKTRIE